MPGKHTLSVCSTNNLGVDAMCLRYRHKVLTTSNVESIYMQETSSENIVPFCVKTLITNLYVISTTYRLYETGLT